MGGFLMQKGEIMKPDFYISVDSMNQKQLRALAAELILENIESEAEAQTKYNPLIYVLDKLGDKRNADKIRGNIADEKNHLLIDQAMLQEYDGDIKIASDGSEEAIDEIEKSIEEKEQ